MVFSKSKISSRSISGDPLKVFVCSSKIFIFFLFSNLEFHYFLAKKNLLQKNTKKSCLSPDCTLQLLACQRELWVSRATQFEDIYFLILEKHKYSQFLKIN